MSRKVFRKLYANSIAKEENDEEKRKPFRHHYSKVRSLDKEIDSLYFAIDTLSKKIDDLKDRRLAETAIALAKAKLLCREEGISFKEFWRRNKSKLNMSYTYANSLANHGLKGVPSDYPFSRLWDKYKVGTSIEDERIKYL